MKPMLRRRIPVLRSMRFLRYDASKDLPPAHNLTFNRCWHRKRIGLHARWGMCCYSFIWKLCK